MNGRILSFVQLWLISGKMNAVRFGTKLSQPRTSLLVSLFDFPFVSGIETYFMHGVRREYRSNVAQLALAFILSSAVCLTLLSNGVYYNGDCELSVLFTAMSFNFPGIISTLLCDTSEGSSLIRSKSIRSAILGIW